jgi:Ca-activated chloride channel family protein
MVPVLDSNIVPVQGSDIAAGLAKAGELFKQSGATRGEIILITDSSPSASALAEAGNLAKQGFVTSVLAIGTKEGTPARDNNGNFATDANGNVSLAHLDVSGLENLARTGSGEYVAFKGDNSDVDSLLKVSALNDLDAKASAESQTESLWQDRGDYLIWGALILFAFLARRGWLEKLC